MKKITLALIAITTLLYACGSDEDEIPNNVGDIVRVDRVFNNTGNTATLNYESNEKLKTFYYENSIKNNVEYDANGKMTKFSIYDDNGDVEKEYTFTYDGNGNISSVHDFYSRPFYTYEPINQDRLVTWNGNVMTVPLLVDDVNNKYDNYEFTFDNNNLLSKYKVTKANGTIRINVTFTYDSNRNPIHVSGFYNFFSQVNVNMSTTFDDKINPYHAHYNKYYINNLIVHGGRPGWFSISDLLLVYYHFGKNNPLIVDSNNPNALYFTYDYNGNKPTKSYYRNTNTIVTTSSFTYQ